MTEVSVIIPAYNAERFIEEALESVFRQTFQDFEIVVIDDGSEDRTASICERYKGKIRYFYQENRGLAAARNAGVQISSAPYISFLDVDDLYLPEKIEVQKEFLDLHPEFDIVFSNFEYFGGRLLRHPIPESFRDGEGNQFLDLFRYNCIAIPTVFARKRLFDEIGFFDETLSAVEDYDLWLRISRKKKIGYIDRVLAKVRLHPENMSKDAELMCASELNVMEKILRENPEIREEHPSLWKIKKSIVYFEAGYKLLVAQDMKKARKKFLSAMRERPLWLKPYAYLLSSTLGARAIQAARAMKRLLSLKR